MDVREHRGRSDTSDRLGGGVERESRADDLVIATDLERLQRQHESVGAIRDSHRVWNSEKRRSFPLERLDFRSKDEATGLEN